MEIEALKAIPVQRWAAPDCLLVLWATWPKLDEAMELVRAWGFEYVTGLPWVKTSPASREIYCGIGFWFQSASEILLIGRRGDPERRGISNAPLRGLLVGEDRQFYAPRNRKHSKKPNGVQDWLETDFFGPYLELFATRKLRGWTCWGRDTGFELSDAGVARIGQERAESSENGQKHPITTAKSLTDF